MLWVYQVLFRRYNWSRSLHEHLYRRWLLWHMDSCNWCLVETVTVDTPLNLPGISLFVNTIVHTLQHEKFRTMFYVFSVSSFLVSFRISNTQIVKWRWYIYILYPKKYVHGFVVLCFVVVMQSFIMNSHEVFIHIHQGCFAGTGAIVRLPQCQWSKPDGYGKISQCITTTKHSKAKTLCIFLGIYCKQLSP